MLSTWIQSKKDEEGFTLIELLVVVIIIGILAAIAIPVFLSQRENAWARAVESDLRNNAIQIESEVTSSGDGYATVLSSYTPQESPNVNIDVVGTPTASSYCLEGTHDSIDPVAAGEGVEASGTWSYSVDAGTQLANVVEEPC